MRLWTVPLLSIIAVAGLHCSGSSTPVGSASSDDSAGPTPPARDWNNYPAIVQIDDANDVYAVSDPHGEYDIFSNLLAGNHFIDAPNADPTQVQWTGGAVILVVAGDMFDKGPESLQVVDLVRSLQAQAPSSGGQVIVTMGNHEAEFMQDPENKKATSTGQDTVGVDNELEADDISPASLVLGTDIAGRGTWISNLPFGVRIKKWFFSHAGNTNEQSINDLEKTLEDAIDKNGYGDTNITGNNSILEAQNWYGDPTDKNAGQKAADALGVNHIVFGHDPGAFGEHGSMTSTKNSILFKLDTAMGIHDSSGGVGQAFLLHINTQGTDTAEVLDDAGNSTKLL